MIHSVKYFTALFISMVLLSAPVHSLKAEPPKTVEDELPLEQLRNFSDIFARIKSNYVEEVDDKALLENAIRGMLSGLDPHSTYLDPDEYKELQIDTTGKFGGLGIRVGMEEGFIKVISPIDDTPAFHAGIKAGDLIIRINNKPVKGMTLNEAIDSMRGEPGSSITLSIIREQEREPLSITLKRAIIKVKSVKSYLIEKNYGYVRISTFQSRTAPHLLEAIHDLKKENKNKLKGLILDLRNNPGGVLNAASDVADLFINEGTLVYTKGRIKNSYFKFKAKPGDTMNKAPIIVLINAGSASASEIVAGALQDHKRAIVMGTKSFGKGSVQTIQELRNGGAVKFTTARYFTPSGRSIQAEGIEPDINLENMKLSEIKSNKLKRIKESDLTGHISNPEEKKSAKKVTPNNNKLFKKLSSDYQVQEALHLLKGLNILRQAKS